MPEELKTVQKPKGIQKQSKKAAKKQRKAERKRLSEIAAKEAAAERKLVPQRATAMQARASWLDKIPCASCREKASQQVLKASRPQVIPPHAGLSMPGSHFW